MIIFSIAVYISFNFDLLWQARKDESYCSNSNNTQKLEYSSESMHAMGNSSSLVEDRQKLFSRPFR